MRIALAAAAIVLGGCGRIAFDAAGDAAGDASSDSSGSDAPSGGLCGHVTDALYCNDFNTADLGAASNEGANYVDNAGVDGSGAYVFVAPPSSSASITYPFMPFVSSGELHLGARMFIEGTTSPAAFLVLAQFGGISDKSSFDAVPGNSIQLVDTLGTDDVTDDGGLPRDRWFCMELAVGVSNGTGGFVRGYVDGAMFAEGYLDQDTLPDELFQTAEVSAYASPSVGGTFVVHVDNFVVSTHPIGCP
ncbi:MAG TPA: hypothetical protein VGM39_01770 [Kofleriaceae bacterium]|jgi:hypothetical protein